MHSYSILLSLFCLSVSSQNVTRRLMRGPSIREFLLCGNTYKVESLAFQGGFGRVFKAQDLQSKALVSVKEVTERAQMEFYQRTEHADNQHIVKFLCGDIAKDGKHYAVHEFITDGELRQYYKTHHLKTSEGLDEEQVREFLRGIASGLEFQLQHKMLGEHIRPENILLADGTTVKLTPEGQSRGGGNKINFQSVGEILYKMFYDALPQTNREHQIQFPGVRIADVSKEMQAFIIDCVSKRITTEDFFHRIRTELGPFTTKRKQSPPAMEPTTTHQYNFCGVDYKVDRYLASGKFGKVYLAEDTRGKQVAIKELMPRNEEQETFLEREMEIARLSRRDNNPNIVNVLCEIDNGKRAYFVMEYSEDGTMEQYIREKGGLCEKEVRMFLAQIANGLRFVKNNNIFYRDLKPENILLSEGRTVAKLTDFGVSKIVLPGKESIRRTKSFVGSMGYTAPEIEDSGVRYI